MPRGGPRPGAGRPNGTKNPETLEKARVQAACRQLYLQKAETIWGAQIKHAQGVQYLMLRRKDGTYARATDQKQVEAWAATGGTTGELFTQAPNVQAFTALEDRVFGKPKETHEHTGAEGGPLVVKWADE
jgi:hypothetical protein